MLTLLGAIVNAVVLVLSTLVKVVSDRCAYIVVTPPFTATSFP